MGHLWRYVLRSDINKTISDSGMAIDFSTFSSPHVGWRAGKPVWVAFSLNKAREIFEDSPSSVVICIVPPHAVIVESFELAVQFFSGDDVAERIANLIFAE